VDIWVSTASNVETPSKYAPLLSIGSKPCDWIIGKGKLGRVDQVPEVPAINAGFRDREHCGGVLLVASVLVGEIPLQRDGDPLVHGFTRGAVLTQSVEETDKRQRYRKAHTSAGEAFPSERWYGNSTIISASGIIRRSNRAGKAKGLRIRKRVGKRKPLEVKHAA
jgi:hypothetical protein